MAVSDHQRRLLHGLNVVATIHHAVDTEVFAFRADPEDYLLFLGRFTPGKGVLEAIEAARRTGMRLLVAAAENEYYREVVAPLVDEHDVVFVGEVDRRGGEPARERAGSDLSGADGGAVRAGAGGSRFMRHAGGGPQSWGRRRKLSKTASLGACSIASTRSLPAFHAFFARSAAGAVQSRGALRGRPDGGRLPGCVRAAGQPRPPHTSRAGMNSPSGVLQGRALLAVFAHPDDESLACGGLLAWCAELGARVSILCATRGEMGRGSVAIAICPSSVRMSSRPPPVRSASVMCSCSTMRTGCWPGPSPRSSKRIFVTRRSAFARMS